MKSQPQKFFLAAISIGILLVLASALLTETRRGPSVRRAFQSPKGGESRENSVSASKGMAPLVDQLTSISRSLEAPERTSDLPMEGKPLSSIKLRVLDEILSTVSDNDPRMDTVLRDFSPEEKEFLVQKYRGLEKELLNKRGILVFLAGRELRRLEDLKFMSEVLLEEPCRSLGHCAEDPKGASQAEDRADSYLGVDMTLVYPQMVAIHSLANKLQQNPSPSELERITEILRSAQNSPHPLVASRAAEVLKKHRK